MPDPEMKTVAVKLDIHTHKLAKNMPNFSQWVREQIMLFNMQDQQWTLQANLETLRRETVEHLKDANRFLKNVTETYSWVSDELEN
jgi:hypothetical protein